MKIMATYVELTLPEGQRQSTRVVNKDDGSTNIKKFQYAVLFTYHFHYRHIVEDHNGLSHMFPSLEQIWVTHNWPTCVFTFILSLFEVNTYLAFRYFVCTKEERICVMKFWPKLGWALMKNIYLDTNTDSQRSTGKAS